MLAADKGDSQLLLLLTSTTTVDYKLFVATYGLVYFQQPLKRPLFLQKEPKEERAPKLFQKAKPSVFSMSQSSSSFMIMGCNAGGICSPQAWRHVDPHMTRSKCSEADKAPSTKSYIRPIPVAVAEKPLYFSTTSTKKKKGSCFTQHRVVVPDPQYGANLLLDWPLQKERSGG